MDHDAFALKFLVILEMRPDEFVALGLAECAVCIGGIIDEADEAHGYLPSLIE
jgi:hypothetical protein